MRLEYKVVHENPLVGENAQIGDPHVHSRVLNDAKHGSEHLLYLAEERGLDFAYIANHDSTQGSEDFMRLVENRQSKVRTGLAQEVSTTDGHLLIWGGERRIRHNMSGEQTIYEARSQHEPVAIGIAHIGYEKTHSFTLSKLEELVKIGLAPDVVEVVNGGANLIESFRGHRLLDRIVPVRSSNEIALEYFIGGDHKVGVIGSTDAHFDGIGFITTGIPKNMTFIEAANQGKTDVRDSGKVEKVGFFDYLEHKMLEYKMALNRHFQRNGIIAYDGPAFSYNAALAEAE